MPAIFRAAYSKNLKIKAIILSAPTSGRIVSSIMSHTALFSPLQAGALALPNRILMAPLTRCRAEAGHVPGPLMAEYYAQRASAGLIIAEATMAMEGNCAFWAEPGIYSDAQVAGWKNVTDAVHAKGGRMVLQIWHGGRACHPLMNDGAQPVAPSADPDHERRGAHANRQGALRHPARTAR